MALLERDAPLAALRGFAADASRGEGRVVLLAGEAGVGKSVLVERLQQDVPDAHWAWGACDGLSTPRPLAPLFDLATTLGGRLEELAGGSADRDELFRTLLAQVTASESLTVLVVEDIHWADEATLDLLRFLARRLHGASVLLLATYRDDSLPTSSPLRVALGELGTLRWVRRLTLASLSAAAVTRLAEGSELDARELFELSGGNPFYVTEMIEAGVRGVPLSARDAVLARAAQLSVEASAVLATASLTGTRVEARVLSRTTGCTAAVLDELIGSGLLVEDGTGLRFRHEIARLAVEQQLPGHRRAAVHADLLASLRAAGVGDEARLAFHAEGAGDDAAALEHSSRAARRAAALGAHREAAAQYERALRSAAAADPATVAGLLTGLAQEAGLGDGWQTAADADERALPLWRELGDRRQEGETLRRYSMALKNLCRGEEGLAAAVQAVQVLEPVGESADLAAAYGTLATVRMMRNEHRDAVELARRAQALGARLGCVDVLADALNTEGCARALLDDGWAEPVRRSLELSLSHNLQTQAARAYNNLYSWLVDKHQFAEAEQYFTDGIAYCEEHDLATFTYCLRSSRTTALERQGRWDETLALSEQLLEPGATSPLNRICPHTRIGTVRARRGEAGVWEALDEAMAVVAGTSQPQCIVPVRLARAEARWLEGRRDEARREAELAADAAVDPDAWAAGALDVWLRRVGSGVTVLDPVAEPFRLEREGRHRDAALAWDERGCPYDAAMALSGASDEAALRDALDRFDDLGATAPARLLRRELRRLGVRSIPAGPRRATRAHPLGLTPRERDVLALVCERATNAEIARRLFISSRTVEHHVSALLVKLEADSREGAAAVARRLDLVGVGVVAE